MNIDYFNYKLNGNLWEEICLKCYHQRYSKEHFEEVPANYKGDHGIEAFTHSGIVIQCYCPQDLNAGNDSIYKGLRKKMTEDLGKLTSLDNKENLKKLGISFPIKEWHFLIPGYPDRRILNHRTNKLEEIQQLKQADPDSYDYISEDFKILLKTMDSLNPELISFLRYEIIESSLKIKIDADPSIDWTEVEIDKVEHVKRKIRAIQPNIDTEELNELLDFYMSSYVQGIAQIESLGENFPDVRKELTSLINSYQKNVKTRTMLSNKSMNQSLFHELGEDFEKKLEKKFPHFEDEFLNDLKFSITASWLADCSMSFK